MSVLASCEEPKGFDVLPVKMQVQRTTKKTLVHYFLEQLSKVQTREEAEQLTELFLKRYKG